MPQLFAAAYTADLAGLCLGAGCCRVTVGNAALSAAAGTVAGSIAGVGVAMTQLAAAGYTADLAGLCLGAGCS